MSRAAPKTLERLQSRLYRGKGGAQSAAYELALRAFEKGDVEAHRILQRAADTDTAPGTKAAAVRGLALLGARWPQDLPLITAQLASSSREVTIAAIRGLWSLGRRATPSAEALEEFEDDADNEIQRDAMHALAAITGRSEWKQRVREPMRVISLPDYPFDDPFWRN
jgi:hypothetical protein